MNNCIICSNEIQNGKCSECNSTFIVLDDINIKKSIIDCEKYNELFNLVYENYKIDKEILKNFFMLELLSYIINVTMSYKDNKLIYGINNTIESRENYQKSLQYIFASYPLFNKDFIVKEENKKNYFLINSKKEIPIILSLNYEYSHFVLCCYVEFDKKYLIPYSIDLLNKEEKDKLQLQLTDQQDQFDEDINSCIINKKTHYEFTLETNMIENFTNITEVYEEISSQLEEIYDYYISLLNEFKEDNKVFFERPLLNIELEDF